MDIANEGPQIGTHTVVGFLTRRPVPPRFYFYFTSTNPASSWGVSALLGLVSKHFPFAL